MGQRVILAVLILVAMVAAGCGDGSTTAGGAEPGEAAPKSGKGAAGMSRDSLQVPAGSENANLPGSKGG